VTYGKMDRGDLADKFMVLTVVDTLEEAQEISSTELEHFETSVHEIHASHYDIDYNIHKLLISEAYKKEQEGGTADAGGNSQSS